MPKRRFQPRPHFTVLTLGSFIVSFAVARTFTYFHPNIVLVSAGIHLHHFWFGLFLLALGGWFGINFNDKRVDMIAAIVYGVGGGLVADEIGLLLTFGNYSSELTWTFLLLMLAVVAVLLLLVRYRHEVFEELHEFVGSKASLYVGVFLAAISISFVVETSNFLVTSLSALLTIVGVLIVLAFLVHQLRQTAERKNSPKNLNMLGAEKDTKKGNDE